MRIAGQEFAGWTEIELLQSVDRPSMFRLKAPSRPEDPSFRASFRPFEFLATDVALDGERIATAAQVLVAPESDAESHTVTMEAVSLPGLLHDVCMPPESWPLEYVGLRLGQIASALCRPFGIDVEAADGDGAPFESVRIEPTQPVLEAITGLARQRGMLVSSTPEGALLLHRAASPGAPAFSLGPGDTPRDGVRASLSASYYSDLIGFQAPRMGRAGGSRSARNPYAPAGLVRPHVFEPEDADEAADLPTAVDAQLGRMVASAARYSVLIPGWRSPTGELLRPNTTVRLHAPHAMIYTETEFLVRSVRLVATAAERYAELELVLHGAFGGTLPEVAPWAG